MQNMTNTTFNHKHLKVRRLVMGLKKADVSRSLGVSHSTICRWESGQEVPKTRRIADVCRVYETTPNKLFGFERCVG